MAHFNSSINAKDGILTSLSQLPTQRQMVIKLAGERAAKEALLTYKERIKEVTKLLPVGELELAIAHSSGILYFNEFDCESLPRSYCCFQEGGDGRGGCTN